MKKPKSMIIKFLWKNNLPKMNGKSLVLKDGNGLLKPVELMIMLVQLKLLKNLSISLLMGNNKTIKFKIIDFSKRLKTTKEKKISWKNNLELEYLNRLGNKYFWN